MRSPPYRMSIEQAERRPVGEERPPRLPSMLSEFRELRGYGYLFRTFFRRDLSARYKASVLGIVWSLLNPLMMMLIYTLVFSHVLKINLPDYPSFFITGFLPWFFFSTAITMGASTLVSHSSLITKVYFPRELLPLSMTAANLVNMGIAYAIFLPYAIYVRGASIPALLMLLPVTLAFFVFTAAIAMLLAAAMVYFRDVEFLIGIALSAWFYGVPVIYSFTLIKSDTIRWWLNRDPLVPFINVYRDAVYDRHIVSAPDLAYLYAIALVTWFLGYAVFNRLKIRVAEEL
jgi:lipopolysaccharide transport system permease protein